MLSHLQGEKGDFDQLGGLAVQAISVPVHAADLLCDPLYTAYTCNMLHFSLVRPLILPNVYRDALSLAQLGTDKQKITTDSTISNLLSCSNGWHHFLDSQEQGLMLKTTLVVKSSLMWFKLNTASLSFAINRFVSMASRAQELWLFPMDMLQGVDCPWLPSEVFKENCREEHSATRVISKCSSSPKSSMEIAAAIVPSVKLNICYAPVANEHSQLSQAQ